MKPLEKEIWWDAPIWRWMTVNEILEFLKLPANARVVQRAHAYHLAVKHNARAGGRKPNPQPCPYCGKLFSGRAMREHKPRCPKR